MTFKKIKKKYSLDASMLAAWFGYANRNSYYNARKGRERLEAGLQKFHRRILLLLIKDFIKWHKKSFGENAKLNEADAHYYENFINQE